MHLHCVTVILEMDEVLKLFLLLIVMGMSLLSLVVVIILLQLSKNVEMVQWLELFAWVRLHFIYIVTFLNEFYY